MDKVKLDEYLHLAKTRPVNDEEARALWFSMTPQERRQAMHLHLAWIFQQNHPEAQPCDQTS